MTSPAAPLIIVKNFSKAVKDSELISALPAFQMQVSRDFAPAWGLDATLKFMPATAPVPPSAWLLGVFDNADQAGALGYHDLTKSGQPIGKVFAKTTMDDGGLWTVTFSHELLEMLADPNVNLCAMDDDHGRLYSYEVCDAVEDDSLGYTIDGVTVSDFVLPGWFEPLHVTKGERFAFKSHVPGPFHLLKGGYIGYMDISSGRGWQQLNAQEAVNARTVQGHEQSPAAYSTRARVGSRRERRRTPKSQWLASIAD